MGKEQNKMASSNVVLHCRRCLCDFPTLPQLTQHPCPSKGARSPPPEQGGVQELQDPFVLIGQDPGEKLFQGEPGANSRTSTHHLGTTKKMQVDRKKDLRSFQPIWTEEYGFVKQDDKAFCVICSGTVTCRTFSVKRHFETIHTSVAAKGAEERKEFISSHLKRKHWLSDSDKSVPSEQNVVVGSTKNVTAASFEIANAIAKHGKPFSDGEYIKKIILDAAPHLFQDFENKDKIIKRIQEVQLSRNTVKDRIIRMSNDVADQLQSDLKTCSAFSICLDDLVLPGRLAIVARYANGEEMYEELIELAVFPVKTRGEDVCETILFELSKVGADVKKMVSVTTDGSSQAMGFLDLLQNHVGHSLICFDCIVHQQVLCVDDGISSLNAVMDSVTEIVNFIVEQDLKKKQFKRLLKDERLNYETLMCDGNRWLFRALSLERFVEGIDEIRLFLKENSKFFSQLYDVEWLSKLMFFTDLSSHLDDLDKLLRGSGKSIDAMFGFIKAFETKLKIFQRDIENSEMKYFPKLKTFLDRSDARGGPTTDLKRLFLNVLRLTTELFSQRFHQFKTIERTLKVIYFPDEFDASDFNAQCFGWLGVEDLEMELAELQSSFMWKQKFVELRGRVEELEKRRLAGDACSVENEILKIWQSMPETFRSLKKVAISILSIFSSTYFCERLFLTMNYTKSDIRNRITNDDLVACVTLQSTNYKPNIKELCSKMTKKSSNVPSNG